MVTASDKEVMERREKRASILIAIILFLLGVVVGSVAIDHLVSEVGGPRGDVCSHADGDCLGALDSKLRQHPRRQYDAHCLYGSQRDGGLSVGRVLENGLQDFWQLVW